jgi:hypothetical protein
MLYRDPVTSFAQIERCKMTVLTTHPGQDPVWFLVAKSDEIARMILTALPVEGFYATLGGDTLFVETGLIRPKLKNWVIPFEFLDKWIEQGLLHVLHTGWLDRNDTRSLKRLGDGYNPYGSFRLRFKEIHTVHAVVISRSHWVG